MRPFDALKCGAAVLLLGTAGATVPVRANGPSAESSSAIALSRAAEQAGDLATARAEVMAGLESEPRNGPLRVRLAEILILIGDPLGAETELRKSLGQGVKVDTIRHLLAAAALQQSDANRALEILSEGPVAPRFTGLAAQVEANAWLARGAMDKSRAAFDIAIRQMPRSSGLWVDVARFRNANFDIGGARDAIDYAIQIDGRNAAAMTVKANLVRAQEGLLPAIQWYEKALALDADHVPALVEYAATLGDLGQYHGMLAALRHAAKLDPKAPRPFLLQAILAARAGKFDLARSLLQRTRGSLDEDPSFMLVNAAVELQLGGASVAADWADQLLMEQPNNLTARRILAAAEWSAGDAESAADILQPITERADADSWSLQLAARTEAAQGKPDKAATLLDRAARLQRGMATPFASSDPYGVLAQAAQREPLNPAKVIPAMRAAIASGSAERAIDAARVLQDNNRGVVDAYLLVGDAQMAGRNYRDAVRAYRDARQLSAGDLVTLRLADAQQMAGEPEGAASTILALLEVNPGSVTANRLAGHLYMDIGRRGQAASRFNHVRQRIGNRDVIILRELSLALLGKNRKNEAHRYAKLAYRLQPANTSVIAAYARTSAAVGQNQIAADLNLKLRLMRDGPRTMTVRTKPVVKTNSPAPAKAATPAKPAKPQAAAKAQPSTASSKAPASNP